MSDETTKSTMTRRELLEKFSAVAVVSVAVASRGGLLGPAFGLSARAEPVSSAAGVDRVVMNRGKTYLNGWVGYGEPPKPNRGGGGNRETPPVEPSGPPLAARWRKVSGPGAVTFADPRSAVTTASFSAPGSYVLEVTADNGRAQASSTLAVRVELPPPPTQLTPVFTKRHAITSPLWSARYKALIVRWIPHCIDQIKRTDLQQGSGGIDNFREAAKALRGEPHATHKGYVFSNAWVHQTVESMCLALMVDAQGDQDIIDAQAKMRVTLEDWIPTILAAQHPDGYLQTAFTLRDPQRWAERWTAQGRSHHEGYTAGYFLESAINHYTMTDHRDARLYTAAKKLADCWADHIGPAPKQEWFDGHQEMEQALVRFGRFVDELEGGGRGQRYIVLAKFLLDCRKNGTEYDQSHVPVVQQYEAVGHAVRAVYSYSAMADVAVETHDVDYQSAVKSIWDNLVHRKYYVTGGVGSGETSEGFGGNYSLRNNAYCESCSSCGEIFFQWKLHLAYHDAQYVDLYDQTLYNALLGGLDQEGLHFYYTNPLAANGQRTSWHNVPCCTGNIPRTLLMLPTWMYSKGADAIYVNLFVGSKVTVEGIAGTDVEMVQTTDYPWHGTVSITVNPAVRKKFTIKIRVPTRDVSHLYTATPDADGMVSLSVNGRTVKPQIANGYATITRTWNAGDTIDLVLPMRVQRVHASEKIPADNNRVALRYGPLIYNIERIDQNIDGVLNPSAPLTPEWRGGLLGGVTVIKGTFADGTPMVAIPNYARYNRNPPAPPPPDSATIAAARAARAAGVTPPRTAPPLPTSIVWIREG